MENVRLSYFKNQNGSAEVLEENNYYPFGLKHEGYNAQLRNPSYNYQYNGKELQKETGWNDYGARMYMADIGRWGVIDPLAETGRRFSPYNYAFNNPVMFIDPDGRLSLAYDNMMPTEGGELPNGGFASYFAGGGSGSANNINAYFGNTGSGWGTVGGSGKSTTIGDMMRGLGVNPSESIGYYKNVIVALSLRQQLINAGWDNPENISAKFDDWWKLVSSKEIPSLNELYRMTKSTFQEDPDNEAPGEAVNKNIYLNMSKINNLLFFAYTIGHEMNRAFDNIFFKDKFIEMTPFGRADSIPFRNTFGLFKEATGLGWEMQMGNTILCGFDGFEAASYYYGPNGIKFYNQETIDKLKPYMNELLRARTIIYNNKKNNLK